MARDEAGYERDSEASLLNRRGYLRLAGAAAASVAGVSATAGTSAAASSDSLLTMDFEQSDYASKFTGGWNQGTHDERVTDPAKTGDHALRVQFPENNHYGIASKYDPVEANHRKSEATELYANMWLRFSSNFTGRTGKFPGPANVEPGGGMGGNPSDGTNGWSARGTFDPSDAGVKIGYYTYHMDQGGTYGDHLWAATVPKGEWVKVGQYAKLNTVSGGSANADGELKMWVDDELQLHETGFRFTEDLSLGCNYFFICYFGGTWTSPQDQSIFFDRVAVSDSQLPDISTGTSQPTGTPFELVSDAGTEGLEYEFTVEGTVTKNTSAGDNASEENDSITQNGDGTVTVTGTTGNGYGDAYYVDGTVTSIRLDETKWTLRYDGQEVTVAELLPSNPPTVERFDVSKSETLGEDRMFSVKWAAADADADLDTVELVVNDGSADLNFAVEDASGGDASGWKLFQFPAGSTVDVILRVTDESGNVTKRSKSVAL